MKCSCVALNMYAFPFLVVVVVWCHQFSNTSPRNCYALHICETSKLNLCPNRNISEGTFVSKYQYRIKCVNLRMGFSDQHSEYIIMIVKCNFVTSNIKDALSTFSFWLLQTCFEVFNTLLFFFFFKIRNDL